MSDRVPEPGNAGSEPDLSHTAEFAKLRAVMRASEKHREGGVDPELEDADAFHRPPRILVGRECLRELDELGAHGVEVGLERGLRRSG